jgi:hypothetical protein
MEEYWWHGAVGLQWNDDYSVSSLVGAAHCACWSS